MQQVIPLIKQGYLSRFLLIIVGYCNKGILFLVLHGFLWDEERTAGIER